MTFAHTGGTLIALNVLGGGLNEVFGFTEAVPSRGRFEVRFGASPLTAAFTDPRERTIRLGDRARQAEERLAAGSRWQSGDLVFTDAKGAPYTRPS